MNIIGVDLGGTKIASAFFSGEDLISRNNLKLNNASGIEVFNLITNEIDNYIKNSGHKIDGIGISVPGIYYSVNGNVWAPNIKGWEDFPLLAKLKELYPLIKLNIDSDRSCYILGELWKGAAKKSKNAIFLSIGTGIGAGILVDGSILRGNNDIAGAVGWFALNKPYFEKYRQYGNFEYFASGDGLARLAVEFLKNKNVKTFLDKELNQIRSEDLFEAFNANNSDAVEILNIAVEYWGMAAANLVSIFNPEKIIWGGGVFGPATVLIDKIKLEAAKWAQPISMRQVEFLPSQLKGDAGLFGAAFLNYYRKIFYV